MRVGTAFMSRVADAGNDAADYSFVVAQKVLGGSFGNVLGPNKERYFSRILCVRNAPSRLTDSGPRITLATDLVVALRAAGSLPMNYSTYMGIYGGDRPGFRQESCDPMNHPIIVNYSTRMIESINPEAMVNVEVYDYCF